MIAPLLDQFIETASRRKLQSPRQALLIWNYEGKQLDLDEGATVRGRRHYTPQELNATVGVERQMGQDDDQPPKRKKIREGRRRKK